MSAFKPSRTGSIYWEKLQKAIDLIKNMKLDVSGQDERIFEDRIAGILSFNFDDFIDQRNIQQVMTMAPMFDHRFRPDMSIGTDNVAIEVKTTKGPSSFRDAIGQALIYRTVYRYIIIVWKDLTPGKTYREVFTREHEVAFLRELEQMNIFCLIK